jgi:cytochrome P450
LAGTDTTANFLTAMILSVYEHPKVLSRLADEINSVIKSDEDINIENFKKLPYLECVIG